MHHNEAIESDSRHIVRSDVCIVLDLCVDINFALIPFRFTNFVVIRLINHNKSDQIINDNESDEGFIIAQNSQTF